MLETEHVEHALDPSLVRTGRLEEKKTIFREKKIECFFFRLDFVVVLSMISNVKHHFICQILPMLSPFNLLRRLSFFILLVYRRLLHSVAFLVKPQIIIWYEI